MPTLLPLILKQHEATNGQIAVITGSLFMILNAVLNSIISFKSDRYRSHWGRRRPFILITTPLVVLFLALIPFASELLKLIDSVPAFTRILAMSPVFPVIVLFAVLVVGFQIFNLFVSSVYYYLIPDVVLEPLLGRFYGLFRLFGTLAGLLYNYFIFGLAETHLKVIFVGIAILYGIVISLMCWRVKEGTYPPPLDTQGSSWWSGIRTYARECFGQSFFWWVFLAYSAPIWANASVGFMVFFGRDELRLSLDQIGKANAYTSLAIALTTYPFGVLVDRWGSHKTLITGFAGRMISSLLAFVAIQGFLSFTVWSLVTNLAAYLAYAAMLKWLVEVYPRDRYGQFGSAGAIFLAPACGWILDTVHCYRIVWLWAAAFNLLGCVASIVVYRRCTTHQEHNSISSG